MSKNKLAKLLLTGFTCAALTVSVLGAASCKKDKDDNPTHEHTYSAWVKTDPDVHYQTCIGDDCTDAAGTKYNEASHDTNGTGGACSVCGYKTETVQHEHTYSDWVKTDPAGHYKTCTGSNCTDAAGTKYYEAAHNTDGEDGACTVCGYKPETVQHTHTPGEWVNNDPAGHYKTCTAQDCDNPAAKLEEGEHNTDGEDGVCTVCGYKAETVQHTHTPGEWVNTDPAGHYKTCTAQDCDNPAAKLEEGEHNTDGEDGACSVCGYKPEKPPVPVTGWTKTQADFTDSAVADYNSSSNKTTADVTVGKFTYATGVYFEGVGAGLRLEKGNFNTQKQSQAVKFELTGAQNAVSFVAKSAAGSSVLTAPFGTISLYKEGVAEPVYTYVFQNGGDLKETIKVGVGGEASLYAEDYTYCEATLDAGTYYIESVDQAVRVGDLVIYEKAGSVTPEVTEYTVTFNPDGGTWSDPKLASQEIKKGETASKPDDPVKNGYKLVKWTLNGAEYDFATPVTADITLVAVWEEDPAQVTTYEVTFDSNGGSTVPTQTVEANGTVTEPQDPVLEGKELAYWHVEGSDKPYDFTTPVTGDLKLVAEWKDPEPVVKQYTVTFDADGGEFEDENLASQLVNDGAKATKPADPVNEGFTFVKWTLNGEEYNFETPVTEDITLVAEWSQNDPEKIYYTVTFKNGTTTVKTVKVLENGSVLSTQMPPAPTKTGYKFLGWYNGTDKLETTTVITGNITYTADWEINKYTVTFKDGTTTINTITEVEHGSTITVPAAPAKEGDYTFNGWYNGSSKLEATTQITADVTYTASWTENTQPAQHEHTPGAWVNTDPAGHYKTCTAQDCDNPTAKLEEGVHNTDGKDGVEGACSVCGYKATPAHTHTYSEWVMTDDGKHYQTCTGNDCTDPAGTEYNEGTHDTDGTDGACSVCGYKAPADVEISITTKYAKEDTVNAGTPIAEGVSFTTNVTADTSGGKVITYKGKSTNSVTRIKLNTMSVTTGDSVTFSNAMQITTKAAAQVLIYAHGTNNDVERKVKLYNDTGAEVEEQSLGFAKDNFVGVAWFKLTSAGTYYFGCTEGTIGIFYVAVVYSEIVETTTKTEEVAATCTKDGNPEYYTSNYGRYFDANNSLILSKAALITTKLGHKYVLDEVTLVPDLTTEGSATVKCTHDNSHTQTVVLPDLNSGYGEPEEVEGNMLKYTYVDEDTNVTITFTVQKKTTYTVTFVNSNLTPAKVEPGNAVSEPAAADLIDENATFVGWYSNEELTQPFDFENTQINEDTNVYAKWTGKLLVAGEKKSVSGSDSTYTSDTTVTADTPVELNGFTFYEGMIFKKKSGFNSGGQSNSTSKLYRAITFTIDTPSKVKLTEWAGKTAGADTIAALYAFDKNSTTYTKCTVDDTNILLKLECKNSSTNFVESGILPAGDYIIKFSKSFNLYSIEVTPYSTTEYTGITGTATKTNYTTDEAKAGINLTGLSLTTDGDDVALDATNSSGMPVAITQDGEDASAAFKAGTAGTYKVTVGKYNMAVTYEVTVA